MRAIKQLHEIMKTGTDKKEFKAHVTFEDGSQGHISADCLSILKKRLKKRGFDLHLLPGVES